ncbi:MAG: hypothetical protein PHG19_12160 [Anaerotignum sp.]|nr:hypothetical protein [Anaerotignum sp.]
MEEPIKSKHAEIVVKISADTEELEMKLDSLTEKANQLKSLLLEIKEIANSLE